MVTSCNMRFGRQALPHVIVLADGSMHQIDDVAGDRWCMPVSFITAFFGEGRGGRAGKKCSPGRRSCGWSCGFPIVSPRTERRGANGVPVDHFKWRYVAIMMDLIWIILDYKDLMIFNIC